MYGQSLLIYLKKYAKADCYSCLLNLSLYLNNLLKFLIIINSFLKLCKKAMRDCTGEEVCQKWFYYINEPICNTDYGVSDWFRLYIAERV